MRYLGVQGTELGTFLVNWYGGVVDAALLLMLISAGAATALTAFSRGYLVRLGGLSLVTLVAIRAAFLAYRLAPQTVVQRLFLVGRWWPRPSSGSMCSLSGRPSIAGNTSIVGWGSPAASWWP